jgi:type VI secretion system protein ImpC
VAGHMEFEFNLRGEAAGKRRHEQPFNLLILGNFSGHVAELAGDAGGVIAKRRIVHVDLDNVDELWSLFAPYLQLQMGSASIELSPRDIDDFHPDRLYRTLPLFGNLFDMRKKLMDPATAQPALDEILTAGAVIEGEIADDAGQSTDTELYKNVADENAGQMFDRLLGRPASQTPAQQAATSQLGKLDAFIRELVAPYIVNDPDPRVETAIDSVDLAIAELMRNILHDGEFQALESRWRSLFDMVSELELDEYLHLYVCDIRREELLAGLPEPGTELQECALFQLLVERRRQATDDTPWSVIVGDYYFGPEPEDIALLTALGAAAAVNGGIFLGGASPGILGCSAVAELADAKYWSATADGSTLWQSLRTSPVADRIGLALPRVLARLPYGEETEEIDSFRFEEMPQRNHEDYLWSNPAFACGRLLAESFTRQGWDMEPGAHVDLGYLPAHNYIEDGEAKLQPCAELLLSESTMVAILDEGLMPLVSYRNQNTAVLGRFQSIASPVAPLSGPWSR